MKKYQQIMADIQEGIESGRFKRGQKLPSVRELSDFYHCSKDTVTKAMLGLKYQHVIYAVEKSGYYIFEDKEFQQVSDDLDPRYFQELPYEDFRACVNESLVGRERYLFNYYHQQEGLEELIDSLQKLLISYDVYTKKEQLVVTAGSQQALYILSQMRFINQAQTILIEQPTYDRMEQLVTEQGLPFQIIERTMDGLDLGKLEQLFQTGNIKFFYTIPRLHNPLGTSYTAEEKQAIVDLANQYDVYIVEDDFLADFDRTHSVPLHYLDTGNRVIYIKSFSTTLFPALRIGAVALPAQLRDSFLQYKSLMDYDTNLIMQKALSLYLDNGMFQRNTKHLQDLFDQKMEKMERIVKSSDLALPYSLRTQGLVIELPHERLTAAIKHSSPRLSIRSAGRYDYLMLEDSASFATDVQILAKHIAKRAD